MLVPAAQSGTGVVGPKHHFAPGTLVVRVRSDAVYPHVDIAGPRLSIRKFPESIESPLGYLRNNAGLTCVSPLFTSSVWAGPMRAFTANSQPRAIAASVAFSDEDDLRGIVILKIDESKSVEQIIHHLRTANAFEYVEAAPSRWLSRSIQASANRQWNLPAINWFGAPLPDTSEIRVAVVDTGIDREHPNLGSQILEYDHGPFSSEDVIGHGTHVAGIISSMPTAEIPFSGLSRCSLRIWKVFDDKPVKGDFYVETSAYLDALRKVGHSDASVVNLSLGGSEHSKVEETLFRILIRRGKTVVAAMGNEAQVGDPIEYPAAYPGVIAVGAVNETLRRAPFSNSGPHLTIMAPGTNVISTLPMKASKYREETEAAAWSGTSMACPHVSAAAAMLYAGGRDLDAAKIRARLVSSAASLRDLKKRNAALYCGCGLLDLKGLLRRRRR